MEIRKFTGFEFANYMYDFNEYRYKIDADREGVFEGFHYFAVSCLNATFDGENVIAAIEDGKVIGVLFFGEYGFPGSTQQALSFIDVHKDYRRQGIAKMMAKELYNHIDHNRPFYLSQLSDEGKRCHIDDVIQRSLLDVNVISNLYC